MDDSPSLWNRVTRRFENSSSVESLEHGLPAMGSKLEDLFEMFGEPANVTTTPQFHESTTYQFVRGSREVDARMLNGELHSLTLWSLTRKEIAAYARFYNGGKRAKERIVQPGYLISLDAIDPELSMEINLTPTGACLSVQTKTYVRGANEDVRDLELDNDDEDVEQLQRVVKKHVTGGQTNLLDYVAASPLRALSPEGKILVYSHEGRAITNELGAIYLSPSRSLNDSFPASAISIVRCLKENNVFWRRHLFHPHYEITRIETDEKDSAFQISTIPRPEHQVLSLPKICLTTEKLQGWALRHNETSPMNPDCVQDMDRFDGDLEFLTAD